MDVETALSHLPQEGCGGRHRSIVVSEGSLVDLWFSVGAAQGLNTDADVARFLLSHHLDDQGCGPQAGDKCRHCGGPLTLVCVKCQRCLEHAMLSLPPSQDSLDQTAPSQDSLDQTAPSQNSLDQTAPSQDSLDQTAPSSIRSEEAVCRQTSLPETPALQLFPVNTAVPERSTSFTDTTVVAEKFTAFTDTTGELWSDQTGTLNVLPCVESDMELDAETFEAEGDENSDTGRDLVPRAGRKALRTKGRVKKAPAKKRTNKRGSVSKPTMKTPVIALRKCDYLLKGVEKTNGEDQQTSQISVKRKQSSKSMSKIREKVTSTSSTQKDQRDRKNNFVKSRKRKDNFPDVKAKMASHDSNDSDKDEVDTEVEQSKSKSNKHPRTEAQTLAQFMTGKYPITIGKPGKEQFRSHHTCSQCGVVVETRSQLDEHERGTGSRSCGVVMETQSQLDGHEREMRSRPCGVQTDTEAASQALDAESIALLERVKDRYLLSCPDCERIFTRKLNLVEHVVSHRCGAGEVKALTCHFCGMKYRHHRTLMNHVEILTTRESCSVCGVAFTAQCQIKAHMTMHAGGQKHKKCKYCEQFVPLKEMRMHYKRHRRENPSCLCPHCGNKFPDKGHLNAHLVVHNKDSLYPCSQCERGFKTLSRLTNHQLHHGERNEQCEHCGKKFFTTKRLRNHIRITHQGERFSCDTCGLKVTERKALDHHIRRVHLKIKPYVCSTCNMSFLQPSHLVMHSRTHTGDKPYHCQYCPAKFAFVHYLRRHEMIHTGERPYSCETCGQQYRDKKSYKEHRKKKHSDKLYPCRLCGKEFPIQDSLNFHLHRVHHVEPDADTSHTVQGSHDATDTSVCSMQGSHHTEPDADTSHTVQGSHDATDTSVTAGQGSHDTSLTPEVSTLPVGDSTSTGIPDSLTALDQQVSQTAGDMEKDLTLFPSADQTDSSHS